MKKLTLLLLLISTVCLGQTAEEYFLIGKDKAESRYHDQAIENYKKAIAIDSTNMNYYWMLSKSILAENIRGHHRTDEGVFEGLAILDKMIQKGAESVKIYERIARANQYVLDDYTNRYNDYKISKNEDNWQDDKDNTKEKERLKNVALKAYNDIIVSCYEILKIEEDHQWAKDKLKYTKAPAFN